MDDDSFFFHFDFLFSFFFRPNNCCRSMRRFPPIFYFSFAALPMFWTFLFHIFFFRGLIVDFDFSFFAYPFFLFKVVPPLCVCAWSDLLPSRFFFCLRLFLSSVSLQDLHCPHLPALFTFLWAWPFSHFWHPPSVFICIFKSFPEPHELTIVFPPPCTFPF